MRMMLLVVLLLLPAARGQAEERWRATMGTVLSNLRDADRNLADFAYQRFNIRRQFDSDGRLRAERTVLAERTFLGDFGFTQQIERDGQPVPAGDRERELTAFRERAAELAAMTPAERQKVEEQERRKRLEENSWLRELPDALTYRQTGEETIDGRVALVLEFTPRPGYKPSSLRARVFEKVRGKIWIDKAATQLVRIDAEVFETVNIGWGVVGRIQKGTRFHAERRVENGHWLPESQTVRFAARLMLIKSIMQEEVTRYSGFRHKSEIMAAE